MKPSFAIVGCGKLGLALATFLKSAGYPLAGLCSQNLSSLEAAAKRIGTNQFGTDPTPLTRIADIVFISTPDQSISEICHRISKDSGFKSGAVVFHCSGALPSTILDSAKSCNARIGSMHPLQSFATDSYESSPFKGICIAIEGDSVAVETAIRISTDLQAVSLTLDTQSKTLYHAAAVAASNYLVTLFDLAGRLIEAAGISEEDALNVLKPLMLGTLSNIERMGHRRALTGPVARGDVATIERHLAEIRRRVPDLETLYKALGAPTVDIAASGNGLAPDIAEILRKLFRP